MALKVRILVYVLDALAESDNHKHLFNLFREAEKSQKAYPFLKPKTRQILDNYAKTPS